MKVHEVRDSIHVFIRYDDAERRVLDSRPFQRLRHIHQLAMTYLVYPGATHRRFEHSLGVMELATRVYDVVTQFPTGSVSSLLPKPGTYEWQYWRRVLRMAALCHDLGHLPFSHAAERELLPEGWDHERITAQIVCDGELKPIWESIKIKAEDVAKIAIGPKKYRDGLFDTWEAILAEIISGDAFGADRMDYLLRDSYHAGVTYGKFDHYRLIDTLRILPKAYEQSEEPCLGVEEGGLHCAEALLFARYFMYIQVYFHPIRRIYDIHLCDFLKDWLPSGKFPTKIEELLKITDNEVTAELLTAAQNSSHRAHLHAQRVVNRKHFRLIYERNPDDCAVNPDAAKNLYDALCGRYGTDNVRFDSFREKSSAVSFPVLNKDSRVVSALALSQTMAKLSLVTVDFVFISLEKREEAKRWLEENRKTLIAPKGEQES